MLLQQKRQAFGSNLGEILMNGGRARGWRRVSRGGNEYHCRRAELDSSANTKRGCVAWAGDRSVSPGLPPNMLLQPPSGGDVGVDLSNGERRSRLSGNTFGSAPGEVADV